MEKKEIQLHTGMLTLKPEDFIDPLPIPESDPQTGIFYTSSQIKNMRREKLKNEHAWMLTLKGPEIPDTHKSEAGSLRCFRMVFQKDVNQVKLKDTKKYPKYRCRCSAVKNSFFCVHHGGGNSFNLKTGEFGSTTSQSGSSYRGAYKAEIGSLFDVFVNDPDMCSLRPEIAAIRTQLRLFIKEIAEANRKPDKPKLMIKTIKKMASDTFLTPEQKFLQIKDYCNQFQTTGSATVLKEVTKASEALSKIIKRMYDIQTSDKFLLTPDGLKIILRQIGTIIDTFVPQEKIPMFKEKLMMLNVRMKTELTDENGQKAMDYSRSIESDE